MPKKKRPEEDPKKQFKRFVKTARTHEANESAHVLDNVFKRLTSPGVRPASSSQAPQAEGGTRPPTRRRPKSL